MVIGADEGFGDFCSSVDREISEIYLGFEIVQRPTGEISRLGLVAGIGADSGVTKVYGVAGPVLDGADKSTATQSCLALMSF